MPEPAAPEYATRLDSIWPPAPPAPSHRTMFQAIVAVARGVTFLGGLLLFLAGPPVAAAATARWWRPHLPTRADVWLRLTTDDTVRHATDNGATGRILLAGGIAVVALLWLVLAVVVLVDLVAQLTRVRIPRPRLPAPLHALVAGTVGAVAVSAAGTTAHAGPPAPVAAAEQPALPQPAAPQPAVTPAATALDARTPTGSPAAIGVASAPDPTHGPVADVVVYQVERRDWLWYVADRFLGDPHRYPEIADLNPQYRHRYRDHHPGFPDHIEPGDRLLLPADAHDRGARRHARGRLLPAIPPAPAAPGTPPATGPPTPPGAPPPTTPPPTTPAPAATGRAPATADPDGVVGAPPASTAPTPAAALTATAAATPGTAPSPATPPADDSPPASIDERGVRLPDGSWIPWTLAGALAAAMAVVWLQRRRRYTPRPLDGSAADDRLGEPDPPAVVRQLQRVWRARPTAGEIVDTPPGAGDEPAPVAPPPGVRVPPVPAIDPPPAGGLGLVGPGAEAAARGALVSALAAGAPTDPNARTEVVIPADTMITLLGVDAVTVRTWPQLRVTADLDAALAVLEERLLRTARLLDDHEVDDLTALRRVAPTEQPLPPMLLVAATPPAGTRARARVVLGLGAGVAVSALLLGEWPPGPTIHIDTDGTCHPGGDTRGDVPSRMAVLDPDAAFDLLRTLREAHTGEPDPPAHPDPERPDTAATTAAEPSNQAPAIDAAPDDEKTPTALPGADEKQAAVAPAGTRDELSATSPPAGTHRTPDAPPAHDAAQAGAVAAELSPTAGDADAAAPTTAAPARAGIRVLGPPHIVDKPVGETLRSDAAELMAYLSVHADGASSDQIMEELWPLVRRRLAAARLHTAASNLRKLLAASVDADPAGFVVKQRGRYRLNPEAVEVDLWVLRRAHATARSAVDGDARVAALREACQAYTGHLADGEDYDWVARHRKGALDLAIDAHTALATAIADSDPGQAARLLHAATDHDPLNEQVCQQAMRAHHRLGDADAVRALLRRLALALDEIGAEPSQETVALADRLRRDLDRRHRPT